MKSMQGGMAMMGQMKTPDAKGGGTSMSPEMMGKRMDMVEMMMDREAARCRQVKEWEPCHGP